MHSIWLSLNLLWKEKAFVLLFLPALFESGFWSCSFSCTSNLPCFLSLGLLRSKLQDKMRYAKYLFMEGMGGEESLHTSHFIIVIQFWHLWKGREKERELDRQRLGLQGTSKGLLARTMWWHQTKDSHCRSSMSLHNRPYYLHSAQSLAGWSPWAVRLRQACSGRFTRTVAGTISLPCSLKHDIWVAHFHDPEIYPWWQANPLVQANF